MFTVLSAVTIVEGMVVKEEDRQLFIFITFSDALHNPISLTYLASCVRVCTYVTAILTAFKMWILTVVFRALKCSLFFLLEKLCSSLQLSSGLRKCWTCCCGNIRSLCTWSFVFFMRLPPLQFHCSYLCHITCSTFSLMLLSRLFKPPIRVYRASPPTQEIVRSSRWGWISPTPHPLGDRWLSLLAAEVLYSANQGAAQRRLENPHSWHPA